jgi:Uncharacterised protein family (UPF0175)
MAVTFDLPNDIEQHLRDELGDLGQTAKEAMLVELYRQQKITQVDLSRALGISRIEAEGVLKKHQVTEDLLTDAEHDAALTRLRAIPDK